MIVAIPIPARLAALAEPATTEFTQWVREMEGEVETLLLENTGPSMHLVGDKVAESKYGGIPITVDCSVLLKCDPEASGACAYWCRLLWTVKVDWDTIRARWPPEDASGEENPICARFLEATKTDEVSVTGTFRQKPSERAFNRRAVDPPI